jgi:glycosyltransferase involved in cell wall biosynthesis
MTRKYIINATALMTSGSLTILMDCIKYLETSSQDKIEYHLFTVINEFDEFKNIKVHKLKIQNWLFRIQWDNGGLQKWCRKHDLEPDAIISLQNTSTKYRNNAGLMIVQIVYYHQSILLYKWNGLEHSLKIIFYHYFYPFFVNRNNSKSHYVVQLPYIKDLFCKRFRNISPDRVTVIRPNKPFIDTTAIKNKEYPVEDKIFRFLFPAAPLDYKNHAVLIYALVKLRNKNPDIIKRIAMLFTVDRLSDHLMNEIALNNLELCIQFIGQVPYSTLLSYYKSADALLFPSKIESFGLPLLEASCFGLPIIACDLPYAREVLEDNINTYFIDPSDANAWAEVMQNYEKYNKIVPKKTNNFENSWKDFFNVVDKLIIERNYFVVTPPPPHIRSKYVKKEKIYYLYDKRVA